ncbi:MAG: hypothetical protein KIT44_03310 [Opitutaceae bacterium]|nr:hypothetical protein [Opitutaceae bacterium]
MPTPLEKKVCLSPERGLPGEGQSRKAVAGARTTTKTTQNGDKHMKTLNKYVGLDVHKDTTVIVVAEEGWAGEVRVYGRISVGLCAVWGDFAEMGAVRNAPNPGRSRRLGRAEV